MSKLPAIVAAAFLLASVGCAAAPANDVVTVTYDQGPSGFTVLIDGRAVKDAVRELQLVAGEKPTVHGVLLVHKTSNLADVLDLFGMMAKAGFSDTKIYVFGIDRDRKTEVMFGRSSAMK